MTWSKVSSLKRSSLLEDDACSKCGGQMVSRPAAPYPVRAQIAFGFSFILFLIFQNSSERIARLPYPKAWIGAWTALQVGLGYWLIQGRIRASKRVYRCIRCSTDLP